MFMIFQGDEYIGSVDASDMNDAVEAFEATFEVRLIEWRAKATRMFEAVTMYGTKYDFARVR